MPGGGSRPGERRGPGRKGIPNKDKVELRSLVQEAVLEFTALRHERVRQQLRTEHGDWTDDQIDEAARDIQPVVEEYDPVVQLAILANDSRCKVDLRRQAASDAAQYLRPKLKTVEHLQDPEAIEMMNQRTQLSERLWDMLNAATAGRSAAQQGMPSPPRPSSDEPDDPVDGEDWK